MSNFSASTLGVTAWIAISTSDSLRVRSSWPGIYLVSLFNILDTPTLRLQIYMQLFSCATIFINIFFCRGEVLGLMLAISIEKKIFG